MEPQWEIAQLLLRGNKGFERGIVVINGDLRHPAQIFLQTFYLHLQLENFFIVFKMLEYTVLSLLLGKS